ncbi:hypothetical protein K474DRAFT_1710214 [Panus rudis PR-1116 ss-1]|nr:hypothetical protein K474DRAFT_1710214 [Panus rudis PR-1116 ss-1]
MKKNAQKRAGVAENEPAAAKDEGFAGVCIRILAPSSAKADIAQIKRASPQMLAYVAIQARFFLNSQPEWKLVDRSFGVERFYWNLVDILKGTVGKELLPWYDRIIFNESPSDTLKAPGLSASPLVSMGLSPLERIEAQIAAAQELQESQRQPGAMLCATDTPTSQNSEGNSEGNGDGDGAE